MKQVIQKLKDEGKSYSEISKIIGLSKSTISYYVGQRKGRNKREIVNCRNCNKEVLSPKTFCDKYCAKEYSAKIRVENLKSGKLLTNDTIRLALIQIKGEKCEICNLTNEWNGKKLTLQVDHIDGDSDNNEMNNLRIICPNCHSQLITTKSKKKKQSKRNQYLRKYKGYENSPVV